MCFEGLARLSRRVWRRFVRGSREISLVPSLHRASTDALIRISYPKRAHSFIAEEPLPVLEIGPVDVIVRAVKINKSFVDLQRSKTNKWFTSSELCTML